MLSVRRRIFLLVLISLGIAPLSLSAQANEGTIEENSSAGAAAPATPTATPTEDSGFFQQLSQSWSDLGEIPQTTIALFLFFFTFLLARRWVTRRLVRAAAATENDLDDRFAHFIRQFSGVATIFLFALWILRIWDVEVSPLLAGAGIVGISLGFAAKEFIADVLAGIFLITDRPMVVGDRIKVERIGSDWGAWGDVIDIGLRRTQIRNTDGVVVNYPNAILSNSVITNFSHDPEPVRVRVRFAVSEESDLAAAITVTEAAIESVPQVMEGVEVVVRSIWDQQRGVLLSGALLEGRYRIADVRERTRIRSDVLIAITEAMRTNGIAFPATPVHLQQPS